MSKFVGTERSSYEKRFLPGLSSQRLRNTALDTNNCDVLACNLFFKATRTFARSIGRDLQVANTVLAFMSQIALLRQ